MTALAKLIWFDIECANPNALAEFYRQLLGWDVTHYGSDAAVIGDGGTASGSAR